MLRSISIALACRCSSGGRQVVLLSSVLVSRGGSLSCGGGYVSPVGCGRRSFRASAPQRPTLPTMTPQNRKPTPPAKSRELRSPGALTPSAGRGKPPRQLTALGRPPKNTTPDSPAFHCAALRSATGRPRARAQPPPRRRSAQNRRHCPGARRVASLTLRSVPLRENRRDRREPRPAHHQS